MNNNFTVGANQAGKSLSDLFDASKAAGQYTPDLGALQQLTGVDPNSKLTAGQNITFNKNDPNSGEFKYLNTTFGAPTSAAQGAQTSAASAYQPAINTLTAQQDPLKARYDNIIKDIQTQRGVSKQQAGINAATEFGKRGLSVNSGQYGDFLQNKIAPIDAQYAGLETTATNEQVDKQTQLAEAIASMQRGGADAGIQSSQFAQTLAANLKNSDAQNALAQATLDFNKQKSNQTSPTQLNTFSQGGVTYSFNPVTGVAKPLTSTGSGGFNASDWS